MIWALCREGLRRSLALWPEPSNSPFQGRPLTLSQPPGIRQAQRLQSVFPLRCIGLEERSGLRPRRKLRWGLEHIFFSGPLFPLWWNGGHFALLSCVPGPAPDAGTGRMHVTPQEDEGGVLVVQSNQHCSRSLKDCRQDWVLAHLVTMTLGLREKNMSLSIYSQGTGSGGEATCQGHTVSEQWDRVSLPLSTALATIPRSLSAAT